ncbi:MAG: lasso peptide isopeptide bond-forming cyclase [Actinomycetota bacterium]|nr:lasso peptide isopeptide bond-forming cyclase [Actinomycetota bacterium]
MVRLPDFGAAPFSWFVVLPDTEAARPVATVLGIRAFQQIDHVSGRPWLLGCWPQAAVTVAEARQAKIALIGQHAMTSAELTEVADRTRTVTDLDRLAQSLVGSSHLVGSVAGQVRVQGTVTGIRRVFHARSGGMTVAADRADVLAWLLDASLDDDRLAVHLLDPPILYPLAGQPVWHGVALLPSDSYLVLNDDGRYHQHKWWSPPEPVVPMAEGAPALRDALSAAVGARVRGRDLVSCDLGGLDSTAVCCVAAHSEAKVVAYTAASQDPMADDVYWASRTVAGLDNVEHHVIPQAHMPLVYHGLEGMEDQLDEPCAAATDRDRWLVIAREAGARGSRLHLTGFGGDELLYGSLAHLHSLLRTHPLLAKRQLRGFAVKYRWPRGRMLSQLWDRSTYSQWLARVGDDLTSPPAPLEEPLLDWGFQPRLPPWVTPAGAEAARKLIRDEVSDVQPLAKGRGQHRELETMRFISRIARQLDQMAARFGVTLAAPYYDDRVVEAGLAVRPQERITPWQYKPLITEAMRGVVPETSRTRQTKANGTCDEDTGLRQNRAALLALWEDSRLARRGLVDAVALREMCIRPMPSQLQIGVLYQTVACEMWLRTLDGAATASKEHR